MKHAALILAFVAVTVACSSSEAQIRKYKSKGVGTYNPFTVEYETAGKTNFGFIIGEGTAVPDPNDGDGNPLTSNWFTFGEVKETFLDGSEIYYTGGGTVEIIPLFGQWHTAVWTGEFKVSRGTKRFANVGPGKINNQVVAVNLPFRLNPDGTPIAGDKWRFVFEINGQLDLSSK